MSWTDDRVSLLKKLWGEGHTAAEIAKQLGGVTRNAVIGKAHRLKLSNRVSPIQQNRKPANKNVETKSSVERVKSIPPMKKTGLVKQAIHKADPIEHVHTNRDDLYSLLDLQPRMCRWPSGDPREPGFGFCGGKTISGIPYCAEHAKVAYQAASRNRILASNDKEEQRIRAQIQMGDQKKVASS